jgi:peptidoglycan/xylan/chitin deacetylase (PgdA/CDA1 family)
MLQFLVFTDGAGKLSGKVARKGKGMIDGVETLRKLTLATMRVTGLAALARPFLGGIGVILMLHRVTAAPAKPLDLNGHLAVRPDFLDAVLADMRQQGYRFVSMDEAVRLVKEPDGGAPFATITLDDGYRDNLTEALPIFEKHDTPFTIYIAPGLIGGNVDLWWEVIEDVVTVNDKVLLATESGAVTWGARTRPEKAKTFHRLMGHLSGGVSEREQHGVVSSLGRLPYFDLLERSRSLLMNWDEIRSIEAHPLGTIGAHTVNHYALRRLDEATARAEIAEAACLLEIEVGTRPRHMAYPYGFASAVGEREARLAGEVGFASAVTTRHGLLHPEHADHLHALPRLSLNGRYQSISHVRTMLSGLTVAMANRGRRVVTM